MHYCMLRRRRTEQVPNEASLALAHDATAAQKPARGNGPAEERHHVETAAEQWPVRFTHFLMGLTVEVSRR